jgi:hypothetical protein
MRACHVYKCKHWIEPHSSIGAAKAHQDGSHEPPTCQHITKHILNCIQTVLAWLRMHTPLPAANPCADQGLVAQVRGMVWNALRSSHLVPVCLNNPMRGFVCALVHPWWPYSGLIWSDHWSTAGITSVLPVHGYHNGMRLPGVISGSCMHVPMYLGDSKGYLGGKQHDFVYCVYPQILVCRYIYLKY